MLVIIHADHDQGPIVLDPSWQCEGSHLLLSGAATAFDSADLPDGAGRPDSRIMTLQSLAPPSSSFEVLRECARSLRHFLASYASPIHFRRLSAAATTVNPDALCDSAEFASGPVSWQQDCSGEVTMFSLAPIVASSPLLAAVAEELMKHDLKDTRRFEFLAAAFTGY